MNTASKLQLAFAVVFALVAGVIWLIFLRPVSTNSAIGRILSKTYRPEGTYWQVHVTAGRSYRQPTPIKLAECYVFQIQAEGISRPVSYTVNMQAGERFSEGQGVRIEYQTRGLPPFWTRVYVMDMTAEDV